MPSSSNPNESSEPILSPDLQSSKLLWLPRLLGTIIILVFVILIIRGCNGARISDEVILTDSTAKAGDIKVETSPVVHESLKVNLPDGVELDAFKSGIEDQLVNFLNNPSSTAGKNVWFDFDNLNFKTGSAEITTESLKQVKNIAAILKAFPKVKIKIGGYTDKTGDSLSNIRLSQGRADAVLAALVTESDKAQLLGAEGYGSQYAAVDAAASDAERQKDRRIAVSVRAK